MILNLPFLPQAFLGLFKPKPNPNPNPNPYPNPNPNQAFVGLFKPLFPKSVQARLKFTQAPVLSKLGELTILTTDAGKRKSFLAEIDNLLDDGFYATGGNM